jgi:hypothetical protein
MEDILQNLQSAGISEYDAGQAFPIDTPIRLAHYLAEMAADLSLGSQITLDDLTNYSIGIYSESPPLSHEFQDNGFAGGDIASETDD